MLRSVSALALTLVSAIPCCLAQQPSSPSATPSEAAFDLAAKAHKAELDDLVISRGLSPLIDARESEPAHLWVPDVLRDHYLSGTSILFYHFAEGGLSAWVIAASGVAAQAEVPVTEEKLASTVDDLRRSIGVEAASLTRAPVRRGLGPMRPAAGPRPSFDFAVSAVTALLLPPPIAEALRDTKFLIVVPALGIGGVPFALLRPFSEGDSLIDGMSVSIAPSLYDIAQSNPRFDAFDDFVQHHGNLRFSFGPSVIVGNPDLSADPDWTFPPLPGAAEEARTIAAAVGGTPLIGKDATKAAVLHAAPGADLLFFATHAVADAANPLDDSFLALSGSSKDDIRWAPRQIQSLHLQASLAVLSACQTGLGKSHDAGIIGLARSFQTAGAQNVVMSLWSVDDAATSEIMRGFIANLSTCSDESCLPAEALRAEMLAYKKLHPDPRLWAPFVVFGTPR